MELEETLRTAWGGQVIKVIQLITAQSQNFLTSGLGLLLGCFS